MDEVPKMLSLSRDMLPIQRVRSLDYGEVDLAHFVTKVALSFRKELGDSKEGVKRPEDVSRHIIIWVAPPRSGKSRFKKRGDEEIHRWLLYQDLMPDVPFESVTWEEQGEKAARDLGLITTPNDKPFNEREIQASNEQVEWNTKLAIERSMFVSVELPAASAALVGGKLRGRPMGTELLLKLERGEAPFDNLPPHTVYYAGLVGGPFLRLIMVYYQDDVKSTNSFTQACKLAVDWGIKPPCNEEEWSEQKQGASASQIMKIERTTNGVTDDLKAGGVIPQADLGVFQAEAEKIADLLKIDRRLILHHFGRAIDTAALIHYLFAQNLKVPSERAFVGLNHPSLEDLGVVDLERLRGPLLNRMGLK